MVGNPLVAGRMTGYGGVWFSDKTGAPLPTFLNVQKFSLKMEIKSSFLHYSMQLFTLSHCYPNQESSMASKKKPTRKPKPLPLARSLHLIEEERKNVARRTRERISLLCIDSEEEPDYGATQTDIAMREVHVEIENWKLAYLFECILFLFVLVMHELLYFQWLYTNTKLERV